MGICGSKNDRIGHDDMLVPANLVDAQLQMLQQFSAFQDIEASEKQDIALALFSVEFQVNAELASQGDTQKEPRLILASEGKCEVFVNIDGVKSLVRTLEAPFYIGEGALLTGKAPNATIIVTQPVRGFILKNDDFSRLGLSDNCVVKVMQREMVLREFERVHAQSGIFEGLKEDRLFIRSLRAYGNRKLQDGSADDIFSASYIEFAIDARAFSFMDAENDPDLLLERAVKIWSTHIDPDDVIYEASEETKYNRMSAPIEYSPGITLKIETTSDQRDKMKQVWRVASRQTSITHGDLDTEMPQFHEEKHDPDSGTAAVASGEDSDIPAAQLRVVNDLLNMFNELQAGSEQIIQTRIIPDFMHSAEYANFLIEKFPPVQFVSKRSSSRSSHERRRSSAHFADAAQRQRRHSTNGAGLGLTDGRFTRRATDEPPPADMNKSAPI